MSTPWSLIEMQAKVTPTALALVTPDSVMRFAELRAAVLGVASRLSRLPLKPGDTIGIAMAGPDDQLLFALGAMRQGLVTAPVTSREGFASLERPALVLTDGSAMKPDGVYVLAADASWYRAAAADIPAEVPMTRESPCRIYISSGSTGRPKAIVQDVGGLLDRILYSAMTIDSATGGQRLLSMMFPVSAWGLRSALSALCAGCAVYYCRSAEEAPRFALTNGCDMLLCSVQQLRAIVDAQKRQPFALPQMQCIIIAGSFMPEGLVRSAQALLAPRVMMIYGSSETGINTYGIAHMHPWEDGATGFLTPWSEIRIVDEDGRDQPPGEEGEIYVRAAGQVPSLGEPASDGGRRWIRPGDRGRMDANGRLTIVGRVGSVFNLGGIKIAADRIEEMLLSHPAVKDAGAIAVRGEDGVDVVEVAVVLSAPATPDEIIAHMRQRMPTAAPRRVLVVKAIPRGGDANKVQREDLKRLMMN
jgi:fatty-acyl-CoA synthase